MKRSVCLLALATTVLAVLPDPADAHGRRHRWWGGVSIGIGVPRSCHTAAWRRRSCSRPRRTAMRSMACCASTLPASQVCSGQALTSCPRAAN